MAQIAGVVAFMILSVVPLIALFTILGALFTRVVSEAQAVIASAPGRAFAIGLVNAVFLSVVCLALAGIVEGLGWQVFIVPLVFVLWVLMAGITVGLSAVAQHVGARLEPADPPWSALRRSNMGALALVLACYVPVLGWFIVLPYVGLLGLGADILAILRRGRRGSRDAPSTGDPDG